MAFPTVNGTPVGSTGIASTSITATMPTGIAVGELLIAFISCTLAQTQAGPAGWLPAVSEFNESGGSVGVEIYKRIADGTEPGSYAFTFGGSCDSTALVFRVGGYDPYTQDGVKGTNSGTSGSTTAITCPAVTLDTTDNLIVRFGATRESNSIADPGGYTAMANASTGTTSTDNSSRCCYETQAGSGTTGTDAFVSTGTNREWCAVTLAIKSPAAAAAAVTPATFLLRA